MTDFSTSVCPGRRRSPTTMPGYRARRPPRSKGRHYRASRSQKTPGVPRAASGRWGTASWWAVGETRFAMGVARRASAHRLRLPLPPWFRSSPATRTRVVRWRPGVRGVAGACGVRSGGRSSGGDVAVSERATGEDETAASWAPSVSAMGQRPSFTGYPFTLGVASGEPVSSGVVLWTRLAPEPLGGGGVGAEPVDVGWEVAEDEAFGRVVQRGTVVARAAWAHSVHVEVSGLEPARWYFYRFMAGDEVSPVGRTRTAPAAAELARQLRLGVGSCQHFEQGFYAAHRHLEGRGSGCDGVCGRLHL